MIHLAYGAWIAANYSNYLAAYGECKTAVERMVAEFPELRKARGFFYSVAWGQREHWWCVTAEGRIIDPTRCQFPDGFALDGAAYHELVGTDEEIADQVPTGVCADCGSPVYGGASFCNENCESATIAYLNDIGRGGDGFGGGRDYDE